MQYIACNLLFKKNYEEVIKNFRIFGIVQDFI